MIFQQFSLSKSDLGRSSGSCFSHFESLPLAVVEIVVAARAAKIAEALF